MKAAEWIDKLKSSKGFPSDYAAAKQLGLSRFTVSGYRQRIDATFDEEIALKVAAALAIAPVIVLADQAMERARSTEARSAWADIVEKLFVNEHTPATVDAVVGGASQEADQPHGRNNWRKRRDSNPR